MGDHLLFCYFSYMTGKIYRVTYNIGKKVADIHLEDGDIKSVPMTQDEWDDNLKGNLIENFKKYLDE